MDTLIPIIAALAVVAVLYVVNDKKKKAKQINAETKAAIEAAVKKAKKKKK